MSDGIKGAVADTVADISEGVVKPVRDEVGKAIEEGVQSVVSGPKTLDPAVQQKKQQDEQKRVAWARHVIAWYKNIQNAQEKVRAEELQKLQAKQSKEQDKKQVEQVDVLEQQKKRQEMSAAQLAARKTELKGGVGG